jgi:hypothetical protein
MAAFLGRMVAGSLGVGQRIGGSIASAMKNSANKKYDAKLEVTNLDEVIRVLKQLDEDYYKQFREDAKDIASDVRGGIQRELRKFSRANPPLSGMRQVHFGRVAWGTTYAPAGRARPKPFDSALIDVPRRMKKNKYGYTPIVRVVVGSPGTVLADMAGISNKYTRAYPITRPYDYMYTIRGQKVPGIRQHKITTQGLEMISNMPGRRPSRYVWKGAEDELPAARKKIDKSITKLNRYINIKLRRSI